MTRRTRRNHTPAFKAQVALAALKSDRTLAELVQQYDIHPNRITDWKRQLTERAVQVFGDAGSPASSDPDLTKLHARIGQLTLENDVFGTCAHQGGQASRKTMIDRSHKLAVSQQCSLLGLARSTACYTPPRPARSRRRTWRRCAGSTNYTLSTRSPAPACCAICYAARASRRGANTSAP